MQRLLPHTPKSLLHSVCGGLRHTHRGTKDSWGQSPRMHALLQGGRHVPPGTRIQMYTDTFMCAPPFFSLLAQEKACCTRNFGASIDTAHNVISSPSSSRCITNTTPSSVLEAQARITSPIKSLQALLHLNRAFADAMSMTWKL